MEFGHLFTIIIVLELLFLFNVHNIGYSTIDTMDFLRDPSTDMPYLKKSLLLLAQCIIFFTTKIHVNQINRRTFITVAFHDGIHYIAFDQIKL